MAARRPRIAPPGQAPLTGLENVWELPQLETGHGISIRRYLTDVGEILIAKGAFEGVTQEARREVSPGSLLKFLIDREVVIDREGRGTSAIRFSDERGQQHRLALAPSESVIYLGNVEAYARSGHKRALNAPTQRLLTNPDRDAPFRAAEHTLRPRLDKMKAMVHVFEGEDKILKQVSGASTRRTRNFGILGSHTDSHLTMVSFGAIADKVLEAVGDQRQWSRDDQLVLRKALQAGFFMDRANDANVDLLNNTANMLRGYVAAKIVGFIDPIGRGEKYLAARKRPVDTVQ